MDENSEAHMETDVSSTTDDVPDTQHVTGSHGDVEMVIVVEKVLDEEDEPIDPKTDNSQAQAVSSATVESSPKKVHPPVKVRTPVKECGGPKSLQKSPIKCDSINTLNKDSAIVSTQENADVRRSESADSSTKTDTIIISPSKATPDTNCIKTQIQLNHKTSVKAIKLVRKPNSVAVPSLQDKLPNQLTNTQEKSPKLVEVSRDVNVQEESLGEIKSSNSTPKKDSVIQNVVQKKSPSKDTAKSPFKIAVETEYTVSSNNIKEKSIAENKNKNADTSNKDNMSVTVNSTVTDIETDQHSKVLTNSNETVKTANNLASDKENEVNNPSDTETIKKIINSVTDNESNKKGLIDKHSDITTGVLVEIDKDNDSQNITDVSEKEHNKSISRELKSLINSAKESKIISECTQLTSKTRKSRSQIDSPNTSLNNTEGEQITTRRGSTHSQASSSSEKSDRAALKRSMRSQNPEFVNKCKQFLNSVMAKGSKGDELPSEGDPEGKPKEKMDAELKTSPPSPKKKKVSDKTVEKTNMGKLRCDLYCWRCHWAVEQEEYDKSHPPRQCSVCPRSFHYKCLSANERKNPSEANKNWVCPDCLLILAAESSETRSPAMKKTPLGMLCVLLKHALDRMMDLNGAEPFVHPVDRKAFPEYDKYVVHPMDLTQMKKNIEDSVYGSTEAFVADAQWILHNSIIFNTLQSKYTGGARALVRSCKAEMGEIEACPECYAAAHAHKPTWFTDVCSTPHILLWAKLKGFPYWPAKGMTVNSSGLVDVRFFGAHDRAWVPAKDCFLYSEKDPNNFRTKRQDILDSMMEAEHHISNISRKYGKFVYPPFKTPFEPAQVTEQLKIMIPTFEGEVILKEKILASPAPTKDRRKSKGSKNSNEGEASEAEDTSMISQTGTPKGKESNIDKDKLMDVDPSDTTPSQIHTIPTRKRRRSNLEEAVVTIVDVPTDKKKKPEKENETEASVSSSAEKKKLEPPKASSNVEKTPSKKETEPTDANAKKKTETPSKSKDVEPSCSVLEEQESQRVTPIMLVALPRTSKQTPKMFTTTKAVSKPDTPKQDDKTPQKTKTTRSDKTPVSEKATDKKEKRRLSRLNRSANSSPKSSPRSSKSVEKKPDSGSETSTGKEAKIQTKENKKKESSQAKESSQVKESSQAKESESEADKSSNVIEPKPTESPKSTKERLHFDDETSLAVIARKTRNTSGMPTITNVCSLSTTAQATSTTVTQSTSANTIEITIEANSDSSIFTPTSTSTLSSAKDVVSKLEKLRNNESLVGRVGVKAFARMTSPNRANDGVQVEIKTEPIELDEVDAARMDEKMDLMNACKLQPVSQAQSLRSVRINRVTVGPSQAAKKKPEVRPRAKKTFPTPRRPEPQDNRSELNGKNSMVYIPIQPPTTPGPVRGPRPIVHSVIRPLGNACGNKTVNTVTTPLKPATSAITSTALVPTSTVASAGQHLPTLGQGSAPGPTVGQVPTTVHTVPLVTSVNGQWMLSLQPVMSVGGVDNPNQTLVNGVPDRNAASALLPIAAANAPGPAQAKRNENAPTELPRLQQRPPLSYPLDPSASVSSLAVPAAAGPISAKINQHATKLADLFRNLLEDSIERVDDPLAAATSFRLQLEQARWRHQQELEETKHNHELSLAEMRLTFEKEKHRVVSEARRVALMELDNAVRHAKAKQWCAHCQQEAQYYCCWNTAYCDYPCQRAHWPNHYTTCTQTNKDVSEDSDTSPTESRLQPPENMPSLQKSVPSPSSSARPQALYAPADNAINKTSIIVSVDESGGGGVKCVGTYKAGALPPLLLNKQVITDDSGKKVVTSGGYLIVGGSSSSAVATPAPPRMTHAIIQHVNR